MSNVLYFHVEEPILRLSDHSKISVRLFTNFSRDEYKQSLQDFPDQFKWDNVSPQLFYNELQSGEIANRLQAVLDMQTSSKVEVNDSVDKFSDILYRAGNKCLKKKKMRKGTLQINKKWFDLDLIKMRKALDLKGKQFVKYPNDPVVRESFFRHRKLYSKLCKYKRKQYKANLIDELNNLFEKDPNAYWSLLNELKDNKTMTAETMTSSEEMLQHFSNLNSLPNSSKGQRKYRSY